MGPEVKHGPEGWGSLSGGAQWRFVDAEFLVEVILTPAGKVNEQSRLCQSYKVTPEVHEIRMPDKLRAVEQLAKLCGFNEPEKMEIEHGYKAQQELVEVIARLRGRGATRNNQCAG